MPPDFSDYIRDAWIGLLVIWLLAAFRTKRTVRRQSVSSRLLIVGLVVLTGYLTFDAERLRLGVLNRRLLPKTPALGWIGLALTVAGIGFALLARFYLGRNWSGVVTVKQDHELIRSGPYRFLRHPIYAGLLLALIGTEIVFGRGWAFLVVGMVLLIFVYKIRLEEQFMIEQFGEEYLQYKRETKALIPLVL